MARPDLPELYDPFVHQDCIHNQVIAVSNRVIGDVPMTTRKASKELDLGFDLIARSLPQTVQQELDAFYQNYPKKKRDRYARAHDELMTFGRSKYDARVTQFVKCEKMCPYKTTPEKNDNKNSDPRPVQFRDPRYCVLLASYLKPMEHNLYNLKIKHPLISKTRLVGKGMNQVERANCLKKKMERFNKPAAVSLDSSRFDQHCNKFLLEKEHGVYLKSNNSTELRQLLREQIHNKCSSRLGLKYKTLGKRMSGDMNTALGNCIIMIGMVLTIMITLGKKFDIFDDGDDCLVIMEEEDLPNFLEQAPAMFLRYGHEIKIENIAQELYDVNWCQSKPINCKYGWKFVRNWVKVLSTGLVSKKFLNAPEWVRLEYLAGLASCEFTLNVGVPVLQEYALAIMRNSRGAKPRFDTSSGEWFRSIRENRLYRSLVDTVDTEITDDARETFSLAWGVSVQRQLDIEQYLRNWTFPVMGDQDVFETIDPETWINNRDHPEVQ